MLEKGMNLLRIFANDIYADKDMITCILGVDGNGKIAIIDEMLDKIAKDKPHGSSNLVFTLRF